VKNKKLTSLLITNRG